ncbi:hypothetical protein [Actinomadura fibrosa]|uniref:DUF4288 domain-containing protein n=1 Tax=Actinomadura fibrosa TaxID=111802 RepID=A0ABW2Y0H5_9ACTN|nr:hypothetical protein [Actinomadura fibrosa]
MADGHGEGWFGVRCLFRDADAGLYEERITLWQARDHQEAIRLAEREAVDYAGALEGVTFIGLSQSFSLEAAPGHGSEVFSLMRESELSEDDYLTRFFDTGSERQGEL